MVIIGLANPVLISQKSYTGQSWMLCIMYQEGMYLGAIIFKTIIKSLFIITHAITYSLLLALKDAWVEAGTKLVARVNDFAAILPAAAKDSSLLFY